MAVSGLILAGGQSTRMGQDKALIQIAHRPLLQHVHSIAKAVANPVKIVTPWPERYRAIAPGADFIHEQQGLNSTAEGNATARSQGPAVGLLQGLAQVSTEWVLVLACDLPCLSPDSLSRWRNQLPWLPPQIVAYLPRQRDRWEPLCGFYRASCADSLRAFIATGGRSFQGWLANVPVQAIPEVDAAQLFNLNTPSDLERLAVSADVQP